MIEVTSATRVTSGEDIMDARRPIIEITVNPRQAASDRIVLKMDARTARALARMLNRHANFISPTAKRRSR